MKSAKSVLCALAIVVGTTAIAVAAIPKFCMECNFSGQNIPGSDLSNGVYFASNFESADLAGASFRGSRVVAANFEKSDLRGAAFDGVDCLACNFAAAKLDGATFARSAMAAANFAGFDSRVDTIQLRSLLAGCIACNFSKAQLRGQDLSELPLISIDFSKADLRQVRFDGAMLCWYHNAGPQRQIQCDKLGGAQTAGATFAGVQVCDDPLDRASCSAVPAADFLRLSGLRSLSAP